jgi:chaperonin GroEL
MKINKKEVKNSTPLKMGSNEIVLRSKAHKKLKKGINKLAETVLLTMGPYGKTVIIIGADGVPYITKDGVSAAKKIHFKDPVQNIAATLIKEVAERTLYTVGDGTTTSICLANEFINIGYKLMENGLPYLEVKKRLELLATETVKLLEKGAKKFKKSDIIDVATISANNDEKLGKLIAEAYKHSSIVKVFQGYKEEDDLVLLDGMELSTSYPDKAFINNMDKQSIKYDEEFNVIVIDGKLEDLKCISELITTNGKNFIIIADHFGQAVTTTLKDNHNRNALTIVPIKSPGFLQHRKDLLHDIAAFTGAIVVDPKKKYANKETLGKASRVEVTTEKAYISVHEPQSKERLESLKIYRDSLEKGHEKDLASKRIEALSGKVANIFVGGTSEIEMKERYDRMDDAVRAVGSALQEGIVEGGGVALVRAYNILSNDPYRDKIDQDLLQGLLGPSFTIFINSNKIINASFEQSRFELKVIDPLKVTKSALLNAVSVASTILSTDAVVLTEDLWK